MEKFPAWSWVSGSIFAFNFWTCVFTHLLTQLLQIKLQPKNPLIAKSEANVPHPLIWKLHSVKCRTSTSHDDYGCFILPFNWTLPLYFPAMLLMWLERSASWSLSLEHCWPHCSMEGEESLSHSQAQKSIPKELIIHHVLLAGSAPLFFSRALWFLR